MLEVRPLLPAALLCTLVGASAAETLPPLLARIASEPPLSFVYGGKPSRELLPSWKRTRDEKGPIYRDPGTGLEVSIEIARYPDEAAYTMDRPAENWDVRVALEGDENSRRKEIRIRTPVRELRQVENFRRSSKYLIVSAIDEHLIKTKEDFDAFARYAPPAEEIDCCLVRHAKAAVREKGLAEACTHGAFNVLNMFRKLDEVLMDPYRDEGFYRAMMEFFTERLIRQARCILAAGADAIDIGANMATSMVGPRFFEDFVLEYENRLASAIGEAGGYRIYHNCGDAASIMHLYNRLDIDVWGYLTPPPFGDVELGRALEVIRPTWC